MVGENIGLGEGGAVVKEDVYLGRSPVEEALGAENVVYFFRQNGENVRPPALTRNVHVANGIDNGLFARVLKECCLTCAGNAVGLRRCEGDKDGRSRAHEQERSNDAEECLSVHEEE